MDEFKNPVIFEQPVVLSLVGQGQQIFSTFTAINSSQYTASYTIQSGDLERSKCGTYTLSNFLLINGGLQSLYYTNRWFSGNAQTVQYDKEINFYWGDEEIIPDVASDFVSIEWSGFLMVPETANYIFSIHSNDGVRLWINQQLVIDEFTVVDQELSGHRIVSQPISLV